MKTNLCFLALLLSAAGAFAQDTLQTSASVVKILSEDLVNRSVVVAVDLSAPTFKEDIAAVSKIIFTRETQKFQLLDLGTGGDVQAGDGIFTATFPLGDKSSVDEVQAQLTTAPFTFNLISDFGANPPVPADLKLQKILPPDDRGNTVKMLANMSASAGILAGRQIFNMKVGSISARFRDDGLRNDGKAGDMTFTASFKATDAELQQLIKSSAAAAAILGKTQTAFVGRSLITQPVVAFNAVTFNAGLPTPITSLAPFLVTKDNLPLLRDKCLMVTDLTVVQDATRTYDPFPWANVPNPSPKGNEAGCWSFGKLIAGVAGVSVPQDALDFAVNWVDTKLFGSGTNSKSSDGAAERSLAKQKFIRAWLKNSGATLATTGFPADWKTKVKVSRFPVRLLAIINRLDLRSNLSFGLSNVGEGRFVFCFVDSNYNGAFGGSSDAFGSMTIILEYGLPLDDCHKVEAYANGWFALKDQSWGPTYNQKLQALTDQFTAGQAAPSKPNGSALNHLRTNEFLQSRRTSPGSLSHDWVIRDFALSTSGQLEHTWNMVAGPEPGFIWNGPVKGTPLLKDLASYVNGLNLKAPAPVPDSLRAIVAPMDVPNVQKKQNGTIWVGSTLKDELMKPSNRREFSLLTCSGCHSAETNIQPFTHVRPRAFNSASSLSSFMVGPAPKVSPIQLSRVTDPVAGAGLPVKEFNDAHRRALDLVDLVFNFKCEPTSPIPDPGPITYTPLPFTH